MYRFKYSRLEGDNQEPRHPVRKEKYWLYYTTQNKTSENSRLISPHSLPPPSDNAALLPRGRWLQGYP